MTNYQLAKKTAQKSAPGMKVVPVSSFNDAVKYLKGETLNAAADMSVPCEKGWVLICTGNLSLGWGKMAAGIIKNHYPKGLRWM